MSGVHFRHCVRHVELHVDGAVQNPSPLVGMEGSVVVVADVAHRTQVVADNERDGGTQSVCSGYPR